MYADFSPPCSKIAGPPDCNVLHDLHDVYTRYCSDWNCLQLLSYPSSFDFSWKSTLGVLSIFYTVKLRFLVENQSLGYFQYSTPVLTKKEKERRKRRKLHVGCLLWCKLTVNNRQSESVISSCTHSTHLLVMHPSLSNEMMNSTQFLSRIPCLYIYIFLCYPFSIS